MQLLCCFLHYRLHIIVKTFVPLLVQFERAFDTSNGLTDLRHAPLSSGVTHGCASWEALPRGGVLSNSSSDTTGVQQPSLLVEVVNSITSLVVVLIEDLIKVLV